MRFDFAAVLYYVHIMYTLSPGRFAFFSPHFQPEDDGFTGEDFPTLPQLTGLFPSPACSGTHVDNPRCTIPGRYCVVLRSSPGEARPCSVQYHVGLKLGTTPAPPAINKPTHINTRPLVHSLSHRLPAGSFVSSCFPSLSRHQKRSRHGDCRCYLHASTWAEPILCCSFQKSLI